MILTSKLKAKSPTAHASANSHQQCFDISSFANESSIYSDSKMITYTVQLHISRRARRRRISGVRLWTTVRSLLQPGG